MKIAIIGAGSLGSALAHAWSGKHEVFLGVRNPGDAKSIAVAKEMNCAGVLSASDAVDKGDVIVLAVPFGAAESILAMVSLQLDGKVVIDATNPLLQDISDLMMGFNDSAAECIARLVPNAKIVKAFNTTGADNVRDPKYPNAGSTRLMMPYSGDDAQAKDVVRQLIEDAGFDPIDVGRLESARLLEPLAMLWIRLALAQGMGTNFGLAVLKR